MIQKNLKLVDIVCEMRDARIPISSQNPELERILGVKPRLILLAKSDMADESATKRWCEFYRESGITALAADCRSGRGLHALYPSAKEVLASLLERLKIKGMGGRPIRMMVVGIPNVGKSSFINRMAGSNRAKVEDRPGVTKGKQWVKVESGLELLDIPGILWPKFEDQTVAEYLAFTGAVKDQVMELEGLASRLLILLAGLYPKQLCARYKLERGEIEGLGGSELLLLVGQKRGMLLRGGEIDTERAAVAVLDDFRGGMIGRITLEFPV